MSSPRAFAASIASRPFLAIYSGYVLVSIALGGVAATQSGWKPALFIALMNALLLALPAGLVWAVDRLVGRLLPALPWAPRRMCAWAGGTLGFALAVLALTLVYPPPPYHDLGLDVRLVREEVSAGQIALFVAAMNLVPALLSLVVEAVARGITGRSEAATRSPAP